MTEHASLERFKKARAIIAKMPSDEHMTFRGVPMEEFTKEQILKVLLWNIQRQRDAFNAHWKESKVFRHWP